MFPNSFLLSDFQHRSVETGLLLNQFAAQANVSGVTAKLNLNYLAVPLLAKVILMGDARRTVFLKGGLMPSFLINKSLSLSNGDQSFQTGDLGLNTFDLPFVAGLGDALPISRTSSLVLEGDYVQSLLNINGSSSGSDVRNQGFLVLASLQIAFE